jgi:2-phosphoglycerate kinase
MIVVKRDGSTQEFDKAKIAKVAQAAGLTIDDAVVLASETEAEISSKDKVTSLEIRDIVSKKLRAKDKYAADMFDWYQKDKEKGLV